MFASKTAGRFAIGLSLLLAASCSEGPRHNVVLVTLDTTRADFLGCYGRPGDPTPNFDALASGGIQFTAALATASLTPVSHASILTGLNPEGHGLRVLSAHGGYRLPAGIPTLTTILKEEGYTTAAVHSAFPVSSYFGFDRGFDVFESFDVEMNKTETHHGWEVSLHQRRSDATTDLAIEALRTLEEPFFLWVHYWDPHDAVVLPPPEYLAKKPVDERGWKKPSRLRYAAEVSYVDQEFGRLLAALEEGGRRDDTIIALTADHGEGLGEHEWIGHRLLYQEQLHVPLILDVPGLPLEQRSRRVEDLVSLIDVLPTVLDYMGIDSPGRCDGRSLRGLIEGSSSGDPAPRRFVYADAINGYDMNSSILRPRPREDFLYCVTDLRWKLIYYPSRPDRSQLFDLVADPDEEVNLYGRERSTRISLLRELARRAPWVTAPFPPDEDGDPDAAAAAREALEKLGYVGGTAAPGIASIRWAWTCPEHESVLLDEPDPCPECGEPLLLRAR